MARYNMVLGDDRAVPPSGRWMGRLMLGTAALAASPVLYEWALVVAARWQTMFGAHVEARTPIWDRLLESWDSARGELLHQGLELAKFKGYSPLAFVAAIAGLALFGSYFLKRD